MPATIAAHAGVLPLAAAHRASPALPTRRASRLAPPRAAPGGDGKGEVLGEDLLARLKVAEAEAQRLKAELAAAQGAAPAPAAEEKGKRIDGGDLRRETLFTSASRERNWLNESDVAFFTGGGPSEAEGGAGESAEAGATVQRRLLLGLLLAGAGAGLSLVPTEDLASAPTKPLFFYILPLLRSQVGGPGGTLALFPFCMFCGLAGRRVGRRAGSRQGGREGSRRGSRPPDAAARRRRRCCWRGWRRCCRRATTLSSRRCWPASWGSPTTCRAT